MTKLICCALVLFSGAVIASSRVSYYNNIDGECGLIIEQKKDLMNLDIKMEVRNHEGNVKGVVANASDGEILLDSRGSGWEELSILYTDKLAIHLAPITDGAKLLEVFETKSSWLGPKRTRTFCTDMILVTAEEFLFHK